MSTLRTFLADEASISPADVCRMFGISRTTLFRWEAADLLPKPERSKGRRVYRRHHIRILGSLVRRSVSEELSAAFRSNASKDKLRAITERLYLTEMFAGDNPNDGLAQLDGLTYKRHLEPATVRLLVDTALDLPAGDSTRVAIWELLEAAEKRQSGGKKPE